jgi:hypothetical protein
VRLGVRAIVTTVSIAGVAGTTLAGVAGTALAGPSFQKGPYLQNVSQSSVTIMWESRGEESCSVQLLNDDDSIARTIDAEVDDVHEVVVGGLDPGRRYRYAVACSRERATGEFATAPLPSAPFMFVVFGDSRSSPGSHRNVVERVRREIPDFLLGTGDMVNEGAVEADWQQFFDVERDLLQENVLFPSLGNHDRQGRGRTADNFRKYFSLPENSPNPERYYAFTYGNSRFLILDSNAYSFALTDQTAWIERQLQSARLDKEIEHVFVAMHHPPYSVSLHGGHTQLREAWTPLFEKYNVDAVFSGHDHCYERAESSGVRYFVSGGGGAPLYPRSKRAKPADIEAVKYMERVNHYLRVHVIGSYVEVTAFRTDGTVMESMSWGELPSDNKALVAFAKGSKIAKPERAAMQAELSEPVETSGGFGLLGKIGALMVVLAGGVIVWTLRQ